MKMRYIGEIKLNELVTGNGRVLVALVLEGENFRKKLMEDRRNNLPMQNKSF